MVEAELKTNDVSYALHGRPPRGRLHCIGGGGGEAKEGIGSTLEICLTSQHYLLRCERGLPGFRCMTRAWKIITIEG